MLGAIPKEKKVKIQKTLGFDYDTILALALECHTPPEMAGVAEEPQEVAARYFNNRDYLLEQLRETFLEGDQLTNELGLALNAFIEFLKNQVYVMRLVADEFDSAYQVFEILNNRGLSLSNKDLFRNFILSQLREAGIANPEQYWLRLDQYALNATFISRYVESKTGRKQRYSAFNDLKHIYEASFQGTLPQPRILAFYKDIEDSLIHYTNIVQLAFKEAVMRHRVEALLHLGNTRHVINVLLALFKNSNEAVQLDFLPVLEQHLLYVLLVPKIRFKQGVFFQSIALLNDGQLETAKQLFELSEDQKEVLRQWLLEGTVRDNDKAKWLLARYFWGKQMRRTGDVVRASLDYQKATLEHVMPQNPAADSQWMVQFSEDFRRQYTYKLGNMTLLTGGTNSRISNLDFQYKKEEYQAAWLEMTQELAQLPTLTEDFLQQRHQRITTVLIQYLGLE